MILVTEIQEFIQNSGLTFKQFSEKFNIGQSTISMWNIGKNNPPKFLIKLLEFKLNYDKEYDDSETIKINPNNITDTVERIKYILNCSKTKNAFSFAKEYSIPQSTLYSWRLDKKHPSQYIFDLLEFRVKAEIKHGLFGTDYSSI